LLVDEDEGQHGAAEAPLIAALLKQDDLKQGPAHAGVNKWVIAHSSSTGMRACFVWANTGMHATDMRVHPFGVGTFHVHKPLRPHACKQRMHTSKAACVFCTACLNGAHTHTHTHCTIMLGNTSKF